MATSSITTVHAARLRFRHTELVLRLAVAAAAVAICYMFRWDWLRLLTCDLNVRLDALAGVHLQRISADTVMWRGEMYRYVIACTFADAWCGAIPLVWNFGLAWRRNLLRLGIFSLALLALNIMRLSFSDVLFAAGVPWWLAHGVVGGIAYFLLWIWIWDHRSWSLAP